MNVAKMIKEFSELALTGLVLKLSVKREKHIQQLSTERLS